jgi:hypothetical protein
MNEPSAIGRHPSGPARRWKPTPLIAGTVALHAGALAAVLAQPGAWPWAVGSVFASHAALTAAGLGRAVRCSARTGRGCRPTPAAGSR